MKRKWAVLCCLAVVLPAGAIGYWYLTTPPPARNGGIADAASPGKTKDQAKPETEEEMQRRKLLGVWQDNYQGKRIMTLKEDGSATMLVELGGVQAFLFASKLRFDMKWTLAGKKLTKQTVGGEPADKVNLILKTMGDSAEDSILELSDDRLLLLDKDGATQYDWRRAKKEEASKE